MAATRHNGNKAGQDGAQAPAGPRAAGAGKAADDRAARLKAALKSNIARRKQQARERGAEASDTQDND